MKTRIPIWMAITLLLSMPMATAPARAVESIRVVGLFKGKAVVQIDGTQRMLSTGQASPEGVKLISANAREAVMEVDGRRDTYALGRHISSTYASAPRQEIAVRVWPDKSGMYRAIGSINGFPVSFLVDTGATHIAMNAAQAKRLGIDYRVVGKQGYASTASGVVKQYMVLLDRVAVGDIELRNVSAGVIDGMHPADVLLGMSFLSRLDMAREGKMLELRKRL